MPASLAGAQPLGSFSWQLQPYCNVVTMTAVQQGAIYTLDGFDDQCGAGQRAPVTGVATPNPDGSVGFGLTVIASPSGAPVHVAARITLAALSGTWSDSTGASGTFAFGARAGGPTRPPAALSGLQLTPGSVGRAQIDTRQMQTRVTGECPMSTFIYRVNEDGTVRCDSAYAPPVSHSGPFRSILFGETLVSSATTVASAQYMQTMTITPRDHGELVFTVSGTCRITSLPTVPVVAVIGLFAPGDAGYAAGEFATVGVPTLSTFGEYHIGFTAERVVPASALVPYTVSARIHRTSGAIALASCSGRLTARMHVGTL